MPHVDNVIKELCVDVSAGYGKCHICGNNVDFRIKEGFSLREARCPVCQGTRRSRDLAKVLMESLLNNESLSIAEGLDLLKALTIYEAQASGSIHDYLSKLPGYTCSEYFDDIEQGASNEKGIRCESLESLTFPDNNFDLVITQDVMEHVRNPKNAFEEICRILRPGGYHIFTIPFHEETNTIERVRKENGKNIYILPPVHHGDPLRGGGSLVYTDFGEDIVDYLKSIGLPTVIALHEKFYPAGIIPRINDESSHKRYLRYRDEGEMIKFFLYNSVVFKSRKEERVNETPTDCERELRVMSKGGQSPDDVLPVLRELLVMLKNESISSTLSVKAGEICFGLGLHKHAKCFFNKALSVDAKNSEALNNLGVLSLHFADYIEAEKLFIQAIELDPANKEARLNLAMIYRYAPQIKQRETDIAVCPCCEGSFPKFIPGGVNFRPGAQCPECGSLERHRLQWLYLKNMTNLFSHNLRVLHFAPEDIFQKAFRLMPNLDYVSADMYSLSAMVKTDITGIPFKDSTFDVIICNHVLEHIMDDRKAMKELLRALKPGGWAILQVPIDLGRERTFEDPSIVSPKDRQRFFGQHDHVRWYGQDYGERLEEAGFKLSVDSYARSLSHELIRKYGLVESEDIYYCTRPFADMPPIPPQELRFMGETDKEFLEVGDKLVMALKEFAGLSVNSYVLDIGSGYGRLAHAMIRDEEINVNYMGIEILSKHFEWCRENIESFDSKFKFVHLDVASDRYNPAGKIDPKHIVFPFKDDSFDIICLTSVFTHMYEDWIIRYLKEIKRMLRPDGRCFSTFFLLDEIWRRLQKQGKCSVDLAHKLNDHTHYLSKEDPLHAIGYNEIWIRGVLSALDLEAINIRHGTWSGKRDYDMYQDIVMFQKK